MTEFALEILIKSTVGVLLAWASASVLRYSAARHIVWSGALVGVLLLPVIGLALPRWEIAAPEFAREPRVLGSYSKEGGQPRASLTTASLDESPPAHFVTASGRSKFAAPAWPQVLLALWLGGTLILLARLAADLVRVRHLTHRAMPPPQAMNLRARDTAAMLRLRCPIRLGLSQDIPVPVTWGWWRPEVLLPSSAVEWSEHRLHIVLLHELAHIQRRDYLSHLAGQLCCAAQWLNPAVWLAARQAHLEQERACDEQVLEYGVAPGEYAEVLLEIARGTTGRIGLVAAGLGGVRHSALAARVQAILHSGPLHRHRSSAAHRLIAIYGFGVWLPLGIVTAACEVAPENPGTRPATVAPAGELRIQLDRAEVAGAIRMLSSIEPWVRSAGIWALRASENPRLGPLLQPLLEDADTTVRNEAIEAVAGAGKLSPTAPAKPARLGDLLLRGERSRVRVLAATTLRELHQRENLPLWIEAVHDSCESVRWTATRALRDLADPRALPTITERLREDPYVAVRIMAVRALGRYGTPEAVRALKVGLQDSTPEVRAMARRVLRLLGAPRIELLASRD